MADLLRQKFKKEFDDKIIFDNDNNIIVNTRIDRLQREEEQARQTDTTIVTTQNGTENDKTKNVETDSDADTENSTTIDLNIIKEKLEEAKIEEECQASAS